MDYIRTIAFKFAICKTFKSKLIKDPNPQIIKK